MSKKKRKHLCMSAHPWAGGFCTSKRGHLGPCSGMVKSFRGIMRRRTWRIGRGVDYPPDDGKPRRWRYNFVCLKHREHARREMFDRPRCSKCQKPMARMPIRMAMPKKNDPAWKKARVKESNYGFGLIVEWPRK